MTPQWTDAGLARLLNDVKKENGMEQRKDGAQQSLEALLDKAMGRAFNLGQTYWQQADSESYSQNKKADETVAKYHALVAETKAAMLAAREGKS